MAGIKFSGFTTGATSANTLIVGYDSVAGTNNQYTLAELVTGMGITTLYDGDGSITATRTVTIPGTNPGSGSPDLNFNVTNATSGQYGGQVHVKGTSWGTTGNWIPSLRVSADYYNLGTGIANMYLKPRYGSGASGFMIGKSDTTDNTFGIEYWHHGQFSVNNGKATPGAIRLDVNLNTTNIVGIQSLQAGGGWEGSWALRDFTDGVDLINFTVDGKYNVGIGADSGTAADVKARLFVKGETSDNTESAFLIDDSSDVELFSVRNDGVVKISGQGYTVLDDSATTTPITGAWGVDWNDSNIQSATLNVATSTMSASNPLTGATYILIITQGATPCVVTWPGTFKWAGGTAPTLSASTGNIDVITLVYDGTNYYGTSVLNLS